MSDLAQALMVAIRVHAKQVDKQGEPYLLHILRVVEAVKWGDERVAAALHDVIEESELTVAEVVERVEQEGFRRRLIDALEALTRKDGETYAAYIDRIAVSPGSGGYIAREVKLADLRDHLGRIPGHRSDCDCCPRCKEFSSLKRRYEKALATLEASS